MKNILKHLVIIPDGNRRWATGKGLPKVAGISKSGAYDNLKALISEAKDQGVQYFSLWGFSTENWERSETEKEAIFSLLRESIKRFREDASKNNLRFRHFGRKDRLPKDIIEGLKSLEKETEKCNGLSVQLLFDYGGRDEIIRAVNEAVKNGKKVDEKMFAELLDSKGIPDPDMIIRTSGEKRTSGLMPFQGAYAELYFVDKFFPEFTPVDLREAVKEFENRKRNFGK